MSQLLEVERMCSPGTAVAFVELKSRLLLLTCKGPWLRVYDQLTRRVLGSKRLFDGQAVHGITSPSTNYDSTSEPCHTQVLVWGGCSVCVVRIEIDEEFSDHSDWRIQVGISNAQAEDWILDACFSPRASISESLVKRFSRAVLVTSHNVLLSLHIPLALSTKDGYCISIHRLANGPRSILYSAHVIWPSHGPGLVAAGTVYGEVLLWSFLSGESTSYSSLGIPGILNYTFKGHEGSVFGVRISEEFSDGESGTRRILASCSDDRTIRIWSIDVSRAQTMHDSIQKAFDGSVRDVSGGYVEERTSKSLVMAMGHASRIWDIRFLGESKSNWHLLSLGEDGTAQTWHLQQLSDVTGRDAKSKSSLQFLHRNTFKFHSGKNIWANTVHQQGDSSLICTGGADGRLVCFTLSRQNSLHLANTLSSQWTLGEVLKDLDKGSDASGRNLPDAREVEPSCRTIFTAFEGHWKLVRHLSSVIPTYPSGVLEGSANFEKRSPTDPMYDAEYLYIENGIFTTEHGVSLVASRRYVYRFEKDSEKISAWFVKSDHGSTVDYLFHNLNFEPLKDASSKMKERAEIDTLIAMGHHPCVDDNYQADYNFQLRGCTLDRWSLKYTVRGPNKDYIADARYVREDVTLRLETESESDQIVKEASKNLNTLQHEVSGDLSQTPGSFKSYTWVNENEFLVSTEKGLLLLGDLTCSRKRNQFSLAGTSPQISWEKIANIPDLKLSCITASILSHEIVIFVGTTGAVYVYRHEKKSIHSPFKVSSKVAYLNSHLLHRPPSVVLSKTSEAFEIAVIISCVGSSKVHLLILDAETKFSDFSVSLNIVLKRSPGFIVTSACFLSLDILVLGSRGGALAIYTSWRDWNDTVEVPNPYYLHHIHDEDTVTNIKGLSGGKSRSNLDAIYFVTTGRNGTYAIHQISLDTSDCETPVKFQTVHVCTPPFGPNVEGACFDRVTSDLLLWGFRSKQFVVWNETQKREIMTVECGGSHRNWAFSPPSNGSSGGTLVWTKASVCKVHSQPNASHQVFQSGGHGREIKAMALSPPVQVMDGSMRRYVATGAEDTAIHIFDGSVDKEAISPQDFRCLGLFTKHSTGIQQLRWSSYGQLLFSAAGCEEFFVWRMSSVPCLEIGLVCEACCPQVTESSDLRIMDFDVAEIRGADDSTGGVFCVQAYLLSMVYSDSSIRVFRYNSAGKQKGFKLFFLGHYTTHCLTQAAHLGLGADIHLCTASTDGHIAFWPLTDILLQNGISGTIESLIESPSHQPSDGNCPSKLSLLTRTRVHQSSIKALTAVPISANLVLLVTGGDDGALAFTLLAHPVVNQPSFHPSSAPPNPSILLLPTVHASAITAVTYLGLSSSPPFASTSPSPRTSSVPSSLPTNPSAHYFATSGNDQRLKIWHVTITTVRQDQQQPGGSAHLEIQKHANVHTSIADLSCMEYYSDHHEGEGQRKEAAGEGERTEEAEGERAKKVGGRILVAGIGMEMFRVL